MNGEMYQIASIVAAGKTALQTDQPIEFTPLKNMENTRFIFLPRKKFLRTKRYSAQNVPEWFGQLKRNGLQDMKLFCPYSVKNRQLLGFSNTTESSILCYFQDGRVTYFTADWQTDSIEKRWNILYSEHEWNNPPSGKPQFENNTDSFLKVLLEIQNFASQIGCEDFAHDFGSAICLLKGGSEYPDRKYHLELPQIPEQNLQIFEAASAADVFGAMGSWNDSPPYLAREKGLDQEYETLSAELLKNIRLAILYAINEW